MLDPKLEAEVTVYRRAKDSVNFAYANPIPLDLIERVAAALYARQSAL